MTGALGMETHPITDIGVAGTDFTATGGLTLADNLALEQGETISNPSDEVIRFSDGTDAFEIDLSSSVSLVATPAEGELTVEGAPGSGGKSGTSVRIQAGAGDGGGEGGHVFLAPGAGGGSGGAPGAVEVLGALNAVSLAGDGSALHGVTADMADDLACAGCVSESELSFDPATQSELDAQTHDGSDIVSGTVAEPRIHSSLARDAEIILTVLAGDGHGTGINADLLDGAHGGAYAWTSHGHFGHVWSGSAHQGQALDLENTYDGSGNSRGLRAYVNSSLGSALFGQAQKLTGWAIGVHGHSNGDTGTGVKGVAASTAGENYGVYGESLSEEGYGVYGLASNTDFGAERYGVVGETNYEGSGVMGIGTHTVRDSNGVFGEARGPQGYGVFGWNSATGTGGSPTGIAALVDATHSGAAALRAHASGSARAAEFNGDVHVSGNLSKTGGGFRIDHPLTPETKYLNHGFVEAPDRKNVYDGIARLDVEGGATVALPPWFEALNRDFRYQLTAIGAPMPDLYIAEEVVGNGFRIAGGEPGRNVSWQITGIRHDAWAEANRMPVEEDKPEEERGLYLHPVEHGLGRELRIGSEAEQHLLESLRTRRSARDRPEVD